MAEYVNRDKLVRDLECGIRAGNYEKGYEKYMHVNTIDDCVDTVIYFEKADVIEREKIDKAIEEMENLFDESLSECPCSEMQFRCGLTRAREILERNIIGDNNG